MSNYQEMKTMNKIKLTKIRGVKQLAKLPLTNPPRCGTPGWGVQVEGVARK